MMLLSVLRCSAADGQRPLRRRDLSLLTIMLPIAHLVATRPILHPPHAQVERLVGELAIAAERAFAICTDARMLLEFHKLI